jgi:hypothetical protein
MLNPTVNPAQLVWKTYEKVLFRLAFIYFFLQTFPLDWKFYRHLLSIDWLHLSFRELFQIAKYTPQFISGTYDPQNWGLATFADWGFIFILAVIGSIIWSFLDQQRDNYARLYACLRIIVRYRLAVAVIAYGFLKLFQLQAPYPSISSLNTPYGDFTTWKMFSLSLGIVPGYESFLGAVELVAGIFLLYRKTATIGATILIFFTGNVFMSNLAYEGGEVVYSFYLVTLALFLVFYDGLRIIKLIILHVPVAPAIPVLTWTKQQQIVRLVLKSALILVFLVVYGFSSHNDAANHGYHFSTQKGLKGFSGLYTVTNFTKNGNMHPYSLEDTARWQDVVFEKWATLSVRINNKDSIYNENVEQVPLTKQESSFESSGATGRRYFRYQADTVRHLLHLKDPHATEAAGTLTYTLQPDSSLLLSGVIRGDTVLATLQKQTKVYLLKAAQKGRRNGLKL